jgi:hypothetical protein
MVYEKYSRGQEVDAAGVLEPQLQSLMRREARYVETQVQHFKQVL